MKVVLLQEVKGLGRAGQTVDVADGYARNFLIPRRLAKPATEAALKEIEEERRRQAEKADRERRAAQEAKAKLDHAEIVFRARAGEGGKLFGSITAQDVAERIAQEFGLAVDKRRVELEGAIKAVGRYPVRVRVHPEAVAQVEVVVLPEAD
ncbi:MAG: 50S ribosomal protein L9 [Firmicutes bacterium]|nr:50S ribosomal protein L9 [Bacillota bacterium]